MAFPTAFDLAQGALAVTLRITMPMVPNSVRPGSTSNTVMILPPAGRAASVAASAFLSVTHGAHAWLANAADEVWGRQRRILYACELLDAVVAPGPPMPQLDHAEATAFLRFACPEWYSLDPTQVATACQKAKVGSGAVARLLSATGGLGVRKDTPHSKVASRIRAARPGRPLGTEMRLAGHLYRWDEAAANVLQQLGAARASPADLPVVDAIVVAACATHAAASGSLDDLDRIAKLLIPNEERIAVAGHLVHGAVDALDSNAVPFDVVLHELLGLASIDDRFAQGLRELREVLDAVGTGPGAGVGADAVLFKLADPGDALDLPLDATATIRRALRREN